jgi:hypothetical protein
MNVIAILRQLSRTHEAHLVMVGNEMDTHGIGQRRLTTKREAVLHSLQSFRIDSRGLRYLQVDLD